MYIKVIDQYYPMWKVSEEKFGEINRGVTSPEYQAAFQMAQAAGYRLDVQRLLVGS